MIQGTRINAELLKAMFDDPALTLIVAEVVRPSPLFSRVSRTSHTQNPLFCPSVELVYLALESGVLDS